MAPRAMSRCLCIFFLVHLAALAAAQAFQQTEGWREPSITLSYDNRTSLAESALNVLSRQIDFTNGTDNSLDSQSAESATLLATMAEYDIRTRTRTFQANVTAALQGFGATANWTNFINSDRLRWGMTFFAAYQAYSDSQQQQFFLESAKTSWNTAAQGFVNQAAAANGLIPGVPPFESTCAPLSGGAPTTVAGAVFWVGQPIINGETIGPWIALSSSLYTATLNTTFRDAAQLSIQFVKNFLSNGTMILDTYEIQSCSLMGPGTFTYNGGYFLQGASVYYSNVSTASIQDLAYLNELAASLILFPGWTGADGVNFEDHITNTTADLSQEQLSADWKAILMTGLYNCLSAGLFNDTVSSLAQQYISVQFNAVRELANYTTSGINEQVYGPSWVTPPIHLQQYLAFGQLAAAELLTTALGVGPGPGSNSSSSSPNTVATTSAVSLKASGKQVNVGAIAGGVVGGVAVLVGALIGALCWRRKKRRVIAPVLEVESPWPEPYMATTEQYPLARHASTLAPAADATGRLTKLQHMRYIPTSSDLNVDHESHSQFGGSSTGHVARTDEQNASGMVAVDAEALQRLLHGIGGALSDLQRRDGARHSTITSMSPPDYYEEVSGERR